MSDRLNGKRALAYTGVQAPTPPNLVIERRAPKLSDNKGYDIGTIWLVKQEPYIFMLVDLNVGGADWIELYPGSAGAASQFPADAGTAVADNNVLQVLGGTNISTVGTSDVLTINLDDDISIGGNLTITSLSPGVAIVDSTGQLTTSDGTKGEILIASDSGLPAWAELDSSDGSIDFTFGDNSIDMRALGGGGAGGIDELVTDFGSATPTAGVVNVLGGTNTNTDASGDTLFINLDDDVTLAGNLTLSSLTEGVLISDNSGVISSTTGNDGELLIGATGAAPTWNTLASSDGSITITNGANSIDLLAVSGGGGGNVAALTADDSNTATPTSGIINIAGGANINTEAASSTITVNLDESISQPATSADGTQGLYSLGGFDFMHAYGNQNTFVGQSAGNRTLSGAEYNTGVGAFALRDLTSGDYNTALGVDAGRPLTTGSYNTAIGADSMGNIHPSSSGNVAVGYQAMALAQGPSTNNVAVGYKALYCNAIASDVISDNIAVGFEAGLNCKSEGNIFLGYQAGSNLTTGDANILIGYQAGDNYSSNESNNIVIDNAGIVSDDNTIRIGTDGIHSSCHIAGIYNASITPDRLVFVDSNDQLGTNPPSADGQLLLGSSTGNVDWGDLTSSDNSIDITYTTGGDLDLSVTGTTDRDSFLGIQSSSLSNVTGDGTWYYLGSNAALTEVFDTENNYDPGGGGTNASFTAGSDGYYYLEMSVLITNAGTSDWANQIVIYTPNRSYTRYNTPMHRNMETQTLNYSVIANMSAGHIATFRVQISGTTKSIGISASDTFVSGYKLQGI